MDAEFAQALAREIMRQLLYLGNFDEFEDSREPDGLHAGAADIIARGVLGEWDKRVEARLRLAKKKGAV